MQTIDLSKINNVHFIGIGGIGISAIAHMMLGEAGPNAEGGRGKNVTGQDMQESDIVRALRDLGADITIGQSFENIPKDTDLIVYTIAIEYYDKELFDKLKGQSIPIKSYPEMLGLASDGKYTIAVAGTHGKTTTTGMIAQILSDAGKDPTVVVGSLLASPLTPLWSTREGKGSFASTLEKAGDEAELKNNKTNFIAGNSDLFVVEACEYRRSFLNISPNILVITNVDEDHLDYYKDIDDIKSAFRELALKVPSDGFVICNPDDKNITDVVKNIPSKIVNCQDFFNENLKLKVPGLHNKKDASSAVAVASLLDISKSDAEKFVSEFPGTARRFEYKGILKSGAKLYDDYAHHPVEIQATLEGFRELYKEEDGWKITVVFQPHLFSRTKLLLADFAKSFVLADKVLLLPIYYAREVDDGSISSKILSDEINKHKNNSMAFDSFESVEKTIRDMNLDEKDIVLTMGAGEAFKIGDSLMKGYNKI